jgi:hypothetical protein
VSAINQSLVLVSKSDTLCMTQKMVHLWCLLVLTNTKNCIFGVGCLGQPTPKINFQ